MRREISAVIARELRDPRIPPVLTITRVELSSDLRNATVGVSVYGGENTTVAEAVKALNTAAPFIQRLVASRITVKHFPRFHFKYDGSIEHAEHIQKLLKEIHDDVE